MANEDYVSYELAAKLKAAGFDEPCHYGYSVKMCLEPEISFGKPKMVHSKALKNYNDNRKGIENGVKFCSAVPLWQTQKWLRKVQNLHIIFQLKVNEDWGAPTDKEVFIIKLRKEI